MMRMELERELLAQPVKALQHMLTRLSLVYDMLPSVAENGRFDEATLEAVLRFQKEFAPPVTGVVDRQTWQKIFDLWEKAEEQLSGPRPVRAFPGNGKQAKPGEWKEYMALPQTMFRSLSHYFEEIELGGTDGVHEEESVRNVRWLQQAAGLEPTGIMDQATWNILSRLYETFVIPEGVLGEEVFPAWG